MTSSTSLMELENILDDNSEGRKRVEDVLGPTCSVKTGHLSIQVSNMYRTAARVSSSSQEKAWSINVAHKVAMSNGYPAGDGATRQARYPS
ncbi:hypothetical protein RB195_004677 [Necator americanus]|uniref:Uncharacterized protein n=1 Tax=Necator americanus TaxID=51031 RepID=A0ABR1BJ74_NECAM